MTRNKPNQMVREPFGSGAVILTSKIQWRIHIIIVRITRIKWFCTFLLVQNHLIIVRFFSSRLDVCICVCAVWTEMKLFFRRAPLKSVTCECDILTRKGKLGVKTRLTFFFSYRPCQCHD